MIGILINTDATKFPIANLPGFDAKSSELIRKGICFARIPDGMQSGESSVAIIARTADGRDIVIETSLKLFAAAGEAFKMMDAEEAKARSIKGN